MAGARRLEVEIIGDPSRLASSFRSAQRDTESFGRSITQHVGGGLASLARAGGIATAAMGGLAVLGLKASADAAIEADQTQSRLVATLQDLGQNSDATKAHIEGVINAQSQMSGFDDEDLTDSFNNIVRVTGNVNEAMTLNQSAMDLARARHLDVAKAGLIMGKVYDGNVSALKRFGITVPPVTAAQDLLKETTKKYTVEQLRAAKAEDVRSTVSNALGEVQKRLGSQAEVYGKSTAGSAERIGVAWENLQETVGSALTPIIADLADWASAKMPGIATAIGAQVSRVAGFFRDHWGQIKGYATTAFGAVMTAWNTTLKPGLLSIGGALASLVKVAREHWNDFRAAAQSTMQWLRANALPTWNTFLGQVKKAWSDHNKGIRSDQSIFLTGLTTMMRELLLGIRSMAEGVLALMRGDWSKAWQSLVSTVRHGAMIMVTIVKTTAQLVVAGLKLLGTQALAGLKAGFDKLPVVVQGALAQLPGSIKSGAVKAVAAAREVGVDIIRGIASGIRDTIPELASAAAAAAKAVPGWFAKKLGIHSPSQVMRDEVGRPIMQGIGVGIMAEASNLGTTTRDAIKQAFENVKGDIPGIASDLGSLVGQALDKTLANNLAALDDSPDAKRLRELLTDQKTKADTRRKGDLQDALNGANFDQNAAQSIYDKASIAAVHAPNDQDAQGALRDAQRDLADATDRAQKAQQDLDDWKESQEIESLQQSLADKKSAYETDAQNRKTAFQQGVADLNANLNAGLVSQQAYNDAIQQMLTDSGVNYGVIGGQLGAAFSLGFQSSVADLVNAVGSLFTGSYATAALQQLGSDIMANLSPTTIAAQRHAGRDDPRSLTVHQHFPGAGDMDPRSLQAAAAWKLQTAT